ncbi:MAG: metallophosphoesterase, partial [Gammaproteobacteria bacterium]|nr:metallophosphoesterase [Gammaproteobacteria bacterium]
MSGDGRHSARNDRARRGSTYLVGDIQGCFESLQALLAEVGFGDADRLWCVGDLVNRGPDSLAVLRFARDLGDRFACVLGNHDLHFLAIWYGGHP